MKTEWVHKKLGECCNSELGKTLDEGRNTGSYRPYLCALNVLWGKIDLSTIKQMRIEEEERERYLVKKGDLLVCEGGEIGRCAMWESDDEIYYQNALHRVRFYKEYDARFFMYLLCHYNDLKLIEQFGKGLTIKHLNQTAFRNIPVCVPDLPAQRRIAAILSSADKVIASTQKIIAKYKQMKQGMMEDLLKPREGWKMVRLGDIGEFYVGGDVDKSCFSPYLTIECKYPIYANALVNEGLYGYSNKYEFDKEAVTITGRGDVGKVFYRKPYFSTIIRLVTLIPTDSNIDVKFLSYAMSRINFIIESTGVPQLTAPQAKKYEVSIPYKEDKPDLTKQRRIAAILSGIDAKIAAEEKVLEKYEKVKKGMMEKLLEQLN